MEIPVFKFAIREDLINEFVNFLPIKAEPYATGWDVKAAPHDKKDIILKPGQYFRIPLGFRAFCPENWYYQLLPRSSSFAKKHMHYLIGIVDESWEGETLFAGQYVPDNSDPNIDLIIKYGEPIAQIIPVSKNNIILESISNEELDFLYKNRGYSRKSEGFGSTDKFIIYKITNKINNKIYIGQTIGTLHDRQNQYKSEADNRPIIHAIKKYGFDNFIFETIDIAKTTKELNEKEIYWIARLNATKKNIGYNIRHGGSNSPIAESTRKILSEQKMGKLNPFFGKTHSEQNKLNMSKLMSDPNGRNYGKKHSIKSKIKMRNAHSKLNEQQRAEIIFLVKNGHTQTEVGKLFNISRKSVSRVLKWEKE